MVIATLDTGSFSFAAAGTDEAHALRTMAAAWRKHRRQYGATWKWEDVRDDVNVMTLDAGQAVRDYSPLVSGIK